MVDLPSYPKIWNVGHSRLVGLLSEPVIVEEKVDGSQFSFGKINGELWCRSKRVQMDIYDPPDLFKPSCDAVIEVKDKLVDGYVYRGEAFKKPKHNTLVYGRIPRNHIALFDVTTGPETYLGYEEKAAEASRLGFDVVPLLFSGQIDATVKLESLLERESFLGGPKIEGFVIKQYKKFDEQTGKVLMGKHVSEAFRELNGVDFKNRNPSQSDIIQKIGDTYRTIARWDKAIQHLREAGELEGSPRDIGKIVKEVPDDILSECKEEIMEVLYSWAWPKIRRHTVSGLAQYYKELLLKAQQEEVSECQSSKS